MNDTPPASIDHASPGKARRPALAALWTLLVIAVLAGGAWWLVQRTKPAPKAGGSGPPAGMFGGGMAGGATVGGAAAQVGEMPVLIDALGTVTSPNTANLVPQVTGALTEVMFREGQAVKKGAVLARIDARPYQQKLAQAKGQLARDQAQLAQAKVTLQRYQTLLRQDSIAQQEVDTQAALVKQLDGTVQAGQAAVKSAEIDVGFTEIRAPSGGLIGLRAVDVGNLVTANSTTLATVTQMNPIDVVFSVPQEQVRAVREAQTAGGSLLVEALDRSRTESLAQGEFLTLDNQANTSTGTVLAKARFDNADGMLFPNQFVNARLQLGTRHGVLVPVTALRTGPDGAYVYVIDTDKIAHMRSVTQGLADAQNALITHGLKAGEMVVTEGGDRVKDGGKVQLIRTDEAAAEGGQKKTSSTLDLPDGLSDDMRQKLETMSPDERRDFLRKQRARQERP